MAVRVSAEMVGTQFHPESDPASILWHLNHPGNKSQIVERWGLAKLRQMQYLANNTDAVAKTHEIIIPGFIDFACRALRPTRLVSPI
jgi:hypothetical protein